jgi:hypothetical protein
MRGQLALEAGCPAIVSRAAAGARSPHGEERGALRAGGGDDGDKGTAGSGVAASDTVAEC